MEKPKRAKRGVYDAPDLTPHPRRYASSRVPSSNLLELPGAESSANVAAGSQLHLRDIQLETGNNPVFQTGLTQSFPQQRQPGVAHSTIDNFFFRWLTTGIFFGFRKNLATFFLEIEIFRCTPLVCQGNCCETQLQMIITNFSGGSYSRIFYLKNRQNHLTYF